MTSHREDRGSHTPDVDPFKASRRPFWITVIGLTVLVSIACANGWIVPFWQR